MTAEARAGPRAFQFLPVADGILASVVTLTRPELEALMLPGEQLPSLVDLLPPRPAWMRRAACRGQPVAAFFPTRDQSSDAARELCARCPVKVECGGYAMADPDLDGTWGGMTARERAVLRREAS